MYWKLRTEFLTARFFDTLYWYSLIDIQCIFHQKLLRQCLRSIIEFLWTPVTRVYQLLFTSSQTISMENLNGKQNLRPEKGICSFLVKFFYCVIDTVYVEYTGLFFVSLLCPCFSCAATLWNKSRARIRPLIIYCLTTMHARKMVI